MYDWWLLLLLAWRAAYVIVWSVMRRARRRVVLTRSCHVTTHAETVRKL